MDERARRGIVFYLVSFVKMLGRFIAPESPSILNFIIYFKPFVRFRLYIYLYKKTARLIVLDREKTIFEIHLKIVLKNPFIINM